MWIKEPPKNIESEVSSISTLNFLYNHEKFYIMDNHLAAAWCWLQKLDVESHYNFFHIDQHEDLLCDAPLSSFEIIQKNPQISLADYLSLKYESYGKREVVVFRYDNYILQTKFIFPHWFDMCYFACPNSVNDKYLNINYNPTCHELSTNISY